MKKKLLAALMCAAMAFALMPTMVFASDAATEVKDAEELVVALENGENVVFADNIKIDPAELSNAYGATGVNVKYGQTIDGNGKTLDIAGAGGTWDSAINTTGGIIKNITITGSFRGVFVNHNSSHSEKVILENVTVDGTVYTISCDQGTYQGLEATESTFNGWTSYAATIGTVSFTNCNFGEGNGYAYLRPYAPTTFTNCTFEEGYEIDTSRTSDITLVNCYMGDTLITEENFTTLLGGDVINVIVNDYITINDDTTKYKTLAEAFVAAGTTDGQVVYHVYGDHDVENTSFSSVKNAKFVGETENACLDLGAKAHTANGAIFSFENLKLKKDNVNYAGFHHAASETYTNCVIDGEYWVYATESSFANCTFNQESPSKYNIWCYGSKTVNFDECTFNTAGKSILVYNEGAVGSAIINIENCEFVANEYYADQNKAAVEIDSSLLKNGGYEVNISGCEYDCKFTSGMWRDKNPSGNLTVNDGNGAGYTEEGHVFELAGKIDATCTTEGYTGDQVCSVCEDVIKGETIKKLDHVYKDGVCSVGGEKDPAYVPPVDDPEDSTQGDADKKPEDTTATDKTTTIPKTADTNNITPWIMVMVSAIILVVVSKKISKTR